MQPFVESLSKCPKHGLHNPFKSPERFIYLFMYCCYSTISLLFFGNENLMTIVCRYLLYGDITAKAARMLSVPKVNYSESKNDVFIHLYDGFQSGILLMIIFFFLFKFAFHC